MGYYSSAFLFYGRKIKVEEQSNIFNLRDHLENICRDTPFSVLTTGSMMHEGPLSLFVIFRKSYLEIMGGRYNHIDYSRISEWERTVEDELKDYLRTDLLECSLDRFFFNELKLESDAHTPGWHIGAFGS